MRLKLVVESQNARSRDAVVSCDATVTVGDVAERLAGDPGGGRTDGVALTLWADADAGGLPRVLSPLLSMHESGLRSGARVSVTEASVQRVTDAAARAWVRVLEGADEGARVALGAGVSFIGRDPAAQVRLVDEKVSRRHASITVWGGAVVITDLNSANGVEVDGERIDRAVVARHSRVRVGDSLLRIEAVPDRSRGHDDKAEFTRSPLVVEPWTGEEIEAPVLPQPTERPRLPWIAVAAPIIAGIALFALTHNPLMLLFVALSPVLMVGMWLDQRLRHRKQNKESLAQFEAALAALRNDLADRGERERAARSREAPSTEEVVRAVLARSPLLWTRMPEHAAFLTVRLGTGTLRSRTVVGMPARRLDSSDEWERLRSVVDEFASVPDVPVVEKFADAGAFGIAGDARAAGVARAMLTQITGLHSPADVALGVFATGEAAQEWAWVKWLPHVDSPHTPLRTPLAGDVRAATRLLVELEELVMRRRGARGGARDVRSHLSSGQPGAAEFWTPVERELVGPAVVVFIADHTGVDRGRLVQLAQDGPDVGVFTIWLANSPSRLPVVCRTFVSVDVGSVDAVFVRHGARVPIVRLETIDLSAAMQTARALAPLEDDGAPVLDESDLPRSVSLVGLFDDPIADEAIAVIDRWAKTDSLPDRWSPGQARDARGLSAIVGQTASGPLRIDLRRDGPHALVGGTTGSGKSEFLQTWILGMAVEHSPERLTFLLVDYKGGSAFGDCVDLPHTVGLVTDLTPHLVTRALTSLRAEVKRREELLAATGAKDLVALEERGEQDAPPSLVIVIDEFAALVTDAPDFIDGVIDIAQRGRSLGLHLIMATQRPAGVIKDSLRANTNLRVALRVADEADSHDVLGTPRAALFDPSTPGRAAAKLGAGKVVDFQTAYVGGRSGESSDSSVAGVEVRDLPFAPGPVWPDPSARLHGETRSGPRDIERLVLTICAAAERLGLRTPRRPWLDPLPDVIDLSALPQSAGRAALGMLDDPSTQRQYPFAVDWDERGSLAVFGAGGTGKTSLLRTVAVAASASGEATWIYAVDFARGLSPLSVLPNTGAVIRGDDAERLVRLLDTLSGWVAERARLLARENAASLRDYNRSAASPLARVIVLVDGMAAFRGEYEFRDAGRVFDTFTTLVAAGRQVGVHFVLTAERPASLPQSLLGSVQERIILRMASNADADLSGVPRGGLDDAAAGRAFVRGAEVQIALPVGSTDLAVQVAEIERIGSTLSATAPPVRRLEEQILWEELPSQVDGAPTLGVADDNLEPVGVPAGLFVVTGPFRSGRTTAMRTAITATRTLFPGTRSYLLAVRPGPLADLPGWTDAATDTDDAEKLAAALTTELAGGANEPILIVVEGSSDFEATAAEATVAKLLKAARRSGMTRVLVETDTVTAGSAWQIFTELKTARAGIVLQPEEADGAGIFRVQFPRATRSDFPIGRGFFVDSGRVRRVQVAITSPEKRT